MHKILLSFVLGFFALEAQAFPCFITLVKDSCWADYDVTVSVTAAGQSVASILVPKGQSWTRHSFQCEPKETLSFTATFSPVIWQGSEAKVYSALHDWSLPETIGKGDSAWNIPLCYPGDFAQVPLPPKAGQNCKCQFEGIPPIKPQK